MRQNLPVTEYEHLFAPEETLVSVTDLKGRITYSNVFFVAVSGFDREELLGQPHNLVRHPDMPAEAYRDLWATIQDGKPWTGVVKNRRKNGDFYWVQANVTPMRDGEQITGYLSVRTLPSREQVQAAEALYARMRAEAQTGRLIHALHQGELRRRDLLGRVLQGRKPSVALQIGLLQLGAVGLALTPALLGAPLGLTALVALGAAAGAGVMLWRLSLRPLRRLVQDAHFLASGDLSHTLETDGHGVLGQLQQAFFQLNVNLRTVVRDVREEVQRLERSVKEIAQGNQDLSARTETQASHLEQTAAAMVQISSTVQNSAASAGEGAQMAAQASALTQAGNEAVKAVSQAMTGITDASRDIQNVVSLIEGVAFQTNLLALNAAVEAARAGEAGRGFAVVAAEVRNLALRTTEAAGEIRQLIDQSAARVAHGSAATAQARERMDESLQAVRQVDVLLAEISSTAREQQAGIGQIDQAIAHLDSFTQQNAALVEQVAAAAQALSNQVQGVSSTMQLLRLQRGEPSLSQLDAVALRRQYRMLEHDGD